MHRVFEKKYIDKQESLAGSNCQTGQLLREGFQMQVTPRPPTPTRILHTVLCPVTHMSKR